MIFIVVTRSVKGVRQGCILSLILFGLYTEELTVRMKQTSCGMKGVIDHE